MKKLLATTGVLAALIVPAIAGRNSVPVYVGGNDGLSTCMSSGTVLGLDPNGDGWLAVKSGPGLDFARIDVLYNGQDVSICDQVGPWMAVVYSKRGQDCGVHVTLINEFGHHTLDHAGMDGSIPAMSATWLDRDF